jgi:hypothetical protein
VDNLSITRTKNDLEKVGQRRTPWDISGQILRLEMS